MSGTLTWLVTGTSRGIGLEIVKQLLATPTNLVIAACRSPEKATALNGLADGAKGTLHVVKLDTSSISSIEAVVEPVQTILGDRGLDYLINNAGINRGMDTAFSFKPSDLLDTFSTNLLGPAHLAQTLLPLLEKAPDGKKFIGNMSSGLGSMGLKNGQPWATYCISKTALSMLTYKQAAEKPELTVIALDPGWVKTDMGGAAAMLEPEDSVKGLLSVITRSTPADSGKFLDYTGREHPW